MASSRPKCSATPRPLGPNRNVECASSMRMRAPWRLATSTISGSTQTSPSIEYTPSTTTSFLPRTPVSLRSRSIGLLWRKKTVLDLARMAPSTMDACEYWSQKMWSPARMIAEMKPTFALYPVGNRIAASLSLKAATALASSLWTSNVPLRIGEPEAPRPYFRVASMAASLTSWRYEMPR